MFNQQTKSKQLAVGDKVMVSSIGRYVGTVKEIVNDETISAKRIVLDFGEFGQSKVYDYDEGKVWFRMANLN